ncbi:hypothetical protein EVAR_3062_1 [Eumeta japonica]|uniref:Uncharacterized protein n=1 Tax=Eumeta variegata TaxID=151549 RepID=A0A4C1STW9_EUMVA|nr:hypothetical protein EVAR_3062_1 [Eumeta japonica]
MPYLLYFFQNGIDDRSRSIGAWLIFDIKVTGLKRLNQFCATLTDSALDASKIKIPLKKTKGSEPNEEKEIIEDVEDIYPGLREVD